MWGWIRSKIESVSSAARDFPFEVGDPVEHADVGSLWALHKGKKKSDDTEVSVFRCDIAKRPASEVAAARDALKRLRTTRHPCVVSHLGDIELDGNLFLVTELVIPLSFQLNEGPLHPGAAFWGLQQIGKALSFFNGSNIIHGFVTPKTIMVDRAGDWKLVGFEVCGTAAEFEAHVRERASLLDSTAAPPEVIRMDFSFLRSAPVHAVDAYYYRKLIQVALNNNLPPVPLLFVWSPSVFLSFFCLFVLCLANRLFCARVIVTSRLAPGACNGHRARSV